MWQKDSRRRRELPDDWSRIRKRVLARDRYLCAFCGAPATDVDHIVPGGDHSLGNLRSLCRTCHMRRTQLQAMDSRKLNGWTRPRKPVHRPKPKHPGYK